MANLKHTTLLLATAALLVSAPAFAGTDSSSGAQQGEPAASQTPVEKAQSRPMGTEMPTTGRSMSTVPSSGNGQSPTGGPSGGVPGRS